MILELSAAVDEAETDFFELIKQIEYAKFKVSKSYPYMSLFLDNVSRENDEEIIEKILESRNSLTDKLSGIIKKAVIKNVEDKSKCDKIKKMTTYAISGITKEKMYPDVEPENIYREIKLYIELIKEITGNTNETKKEGPAMFSASMVP